MHTFHIPVMGLGFTIDTPLKVAQFGISSVISLVDDELIERMRGLHAARSGRPYTPISARMEDHRARRITAYLDLLNELIQEKFIALRDSVNQASGEWRKYMDMLPDTSGLKREFNRLMSAGSVQAAKDWLLNNLKPGSVDVNIMTKLDKENYVKDEKLPVVFNDAHAALRGFANSSLRSSLVLSAGINPRLYAYLEEFEDFFPDADGQFSKTVTLKVSDYKSALVQGKFLAKKGIWVSEFRLESGLNCGGHAFGSDGQLMAPILEEFKQKRKELTDDIYAVYAPALRQKKGLELSGPPRIRFSAQGGVGTAAEHNFLLKHYQLDSVGWGTPFLLVPEVVSIDEGTLELLCKAKEKDLYTSGISPLGVPFNTVRGNTKDLEKERRIRQGRPGSACPKEYSVLNTEFTERPICTASRQYQHLKIAELDTLSLPPEEYSSRYDSITEKSCLCVGLGTSALLANGMETRREGKGVSVCPGPNMAYFSRVVSLNEMVDHIYGRINIIDRTDRPNMFLKELGLYVSNYREKVSKAAGSPEESKKLDRYFENLTAGITYYRGLFAQEAGFDHNREKLLDALDELEDELSKVDTRRKEALMVL